MNMQEWLHGNTKVREEMESYEQEDENEKSPPADNEDQGTHLMIEPEDVTPEKVPPSHSQEVV